MDLDLWWCPVCERAITELEEEPHSTLSNSSQPPPVHTHTKTRLKKHSQPLSSLRLQSHPQTATPAATSHRKFTSRGGVYGPKGGLYCSEHCRSIEEANARRAFEELEAVCLDQQIGTGWPELGELLDQPMLVVGNQDEKCVNRNYLDQKDQLDPCLDDPRRRSLSTGRGSDSGVVGALSEPESGSSPGGVDVIKNGHHARQPNTDGGGRSRDRSNPKKALMLLAPNGTPLIQPTFPQRPGLGTQQRRMASYHPGVALSQPNGLPARLAAMRNMTAHGRLSNLNGKTTNSVPNYGTQNKMAIPKETGGGFIKRDGIADQIMEFEPESRSFQTTSLWQHYGLFYRSRSGNGREWRDEFIRSGSEFEDGAAGQIEASRTQGLNLKKRHTGIETVLMMKQMSYQEQAGSKEGQEKKLVKDVEKSSKNPANGLERFKAVKRNSIDDSGSSRSLPFLMSRLSTHETRLNRTQHHNQHNQSMTTVHKKDWRSIVIEQETKQCSRSWSWDHLPADVPQYPAMNLERVRRSRRELMKNEDIGNTDDEEELKIKTNGGERSHQSRKKLFLFQ